MAPVLCCAPWAEEGAGFRAGGAVSCRDVESRSVCEGLMAAGLQLELDAVPFSPPGWEDTLWPWVIMPLLYRTFCILLSHCFCRPLYVSLLRRYGGLKKWALRYVGVASICANPTHPYPLVLVGVIQLVTSLATMLIFMLDTNLKKTKDEEPGPLRWLEICMGVFFFFHWFIMTMKDEFQVKDMIYNPTVFIDILTVPQLITGARTGCLSLGFLRTYRALYTYERLEMLNKIGVISFWSSASDMLRESVLTLLRFLSIIVLFAGTILVLEVLGELPFPSFLDKDLDHTSMGDISFFTLFYWVIETISTVGYGDYAPKTVPSRLVTMLCMVSGVLFFAIETTKFAEIYGLTMRGTGTYHKNRKDHIVVLGSAVQQLDEGLLTAFFSELYHPEYKLKWPGAVVLVSGEESVAKMMGFVKMNLANECQPLITILQGSAVQSRDLGRCMCGSASLVYILTDTLGRSGLPNHEEDKRNILRALSVRRAYPRAPLRLLLLRPDSKQQATNAGIQSKRCFAMHELKALLFWQSCRCLGWSTLICNLIMTMDEGELDRLRDVGSNLESGAVKSGSPRGSRQRRMSQGTRELTWREAYSEGMSHRIFGFLPQRSLTKSSFRDLIDEAYQNTGVIIFSAQINGDVLLAPFKELEHLEEDTVLFALAKSETQLDALQDKTQDWREVFYRNRFQKFAEDEKNSPRARMRRAGAQLAAKKVPTEAGRPARNSTGTRPNTSSLKEPLLGKSRVKAAALGDDGFEEEDDGSNVFSRQNSVSTFSRKASLVPVEADKTEATGAQANRLRYFFHLEAPMTAEVRLKLEEHAEQIRKEGRGGRPFTTFIELASTWDHAGTFIRESRLKWLPQRMPIIILCPFPPTQRLVDELGLVDDCMVGCYIGSPKQLESLLNAGVQEASVVVCPAVDKIDQEGSALTNDLEELAMVDADAVVAYQTLDAIGVTLRSMMLFEFKRIHNACLLPPRSTTLDFYNQESEHHDIPLQVSSRGQAEEDEDEEHVSFPRRMVKSLLSEGPRPTSFQATLASHPRYVSGRIFTPDCMGSMLARGSYIPGIMEVIESLILPQTQHGVFVWQIHARSSMVNRDRATFGDYWRTLLADKDGPALPLGLYRFLTPQEEHDEEDPPAGFVFTCPPFQTMIRNDDRIYVLAGQAWGHRSHAEGLLSI